MFRIFSSSTSRHAALKEKLKITEGATQLKTCARPEAVEAFWRSYEEICEVLDEIKMQQRTMIRNKNKSPWFSCKNQVF